MGLRTGRDEEDMPNAGQIVAALRDIGATKDLSPDEVTELMKDGIPVKIITDNMAGHILKTGQVDLVVVGLDSPDQYLVDEVEQALAATPLTRWVCPFSPSTTTR